MSQTFEKSLEIPSQALYTFKFYEFPFQYDYLMLLSKVLRTTATYQQLSYYNDWAIVAVVMN